MYTAEISVENERIESQSFVVQFSAVSDIDPNAFEWGSVDIEGIEPYRRSTGERWCCETEIDSCGEDVQCWQALWVQDAKLDLRFHTESALSSQFVHVFYAHPQEIPATTFLVRAPLESGMRYTIDAEPDDEYCVQHDLYEIATGEVFPQLTVCTEVDASEPYGETTEHNSDPNYCIGEPYVDADGDRLPDERSDNQVDGCGCSSGATSSPGARFSVVILLLSLLLVRVSQRF
ncbi:MAG: hypothetical protein ACQEVA_03905 [Myxococcota bacterium]